MPIELLRGINLFSDLEDSQLKVISEFVVNKFYKKCSVIVRETDPGNTMYIINKGKVKISRTIESGKEVILAILGEEDFFGEMSLLDGMERSASVTTLEDSELFILNREDFLDLINRYPKIAIVLLKELALRLRKSDTQIKSLSLYDATGRVASALIQLAEDNGTIKDGIVKVKNLPSQKDLANIAGTSRETISRVLKELMEKGQINKENGDIYISDYAKFKKKFS